MFRIQIFKTYLIIQRFGSQIASKFKTKVKIFYAKMSKCSSKLFRFLTNGTLIVQFLDVFSVRAFRFQIPTVIQLGYG